MTLRNKNFIIGALVLLAFAGIGVFGLLSFSHTNHAAETPMVNCPYAQNGSSICENMLGHINDWRNFSNVIFPALYIFLSLIFWIILHFFNQNFLNKKQYFYKWKYNLYQKKLYTYPNQIIKWLSLFENSPSLSYVRHS